MGAGFARLQRAGEDEEQDCNRNREPSQFKAVVLVKHRVAGCEIGTGVEQRQYNQDIGIPPFHLRLASEEWSSRVQQEEEAGEGQSCRELRLSVVTGRPCREEQRRANETGKQQPLPT